MSSEKRGSWRKGKSVWRGRLYIAADVMSTIQRVAKREEREAVYLMSKAVEKIFGVGQKEGANEKAPSDK